MTKRPQQDALSSNSQVDKTLLDSYAQEFGNSLLRYFLKRGAQKATAEDLTQNVFVRLAKRAAGGEIENAQAYLMQTAASVWSDHLRYRESRCHNKHDEYSEHYENNNHYEYNTYNSYNKNQEYDKNFEHLPASFSPTRVLEGKESVKWLIDVLNNMPERTRLVYVLRRIEGLGRKEVAELLSIGMSTVDKHLMMATTQVTKRFAKEEQ
jgi:RNA polymerase sigma-70 factor (ECF subfamily)